MVARTLKFIFNAFVDLKPVQRYENGSDIMCGFRSLNNSGKRVLDLLEPVVDSLEGCDRVGERGREIEIVTVVKFIMDNGGRNGAGCFEVKIWADTTKFTNMIVARFRKCRDLVREGKVFVKNKAEVTSGVGCSERGVVYSRKLLFKSNKKKFSSRRVESKKTGSHPEVCTVLQYTLAYD